jgi:hypothetical protein
MFGAGGSKNRVLAQETVTGMNGFYPRYTGGAEYRFLIEISFGGRGSFEGIALISQTRPGRAGIWFRIDSNGRNIQFTAGQDDAPGNLAAVGNKDFIEHGMILAGLWENAPDQSGFVWRGGFPVGGKPRCGKINHRSLRHKAGSGRGDFSNLHVLFFLKITADCREKFVLKGYFKEGLPDTFAI